jgi:ribonuclease BN (tRNA processing enzyme)
VHPDGSGSLMALGRFLAQFDQMTAGRVQWHPLRPDDRVSLEDNHFLRAYLTHHVPCADPTRFRSLGYQVGRAVERLKPELRGRPQAEIDRLRAEGGRAAITAREEEILLTVSGDTVPMPAASIRSTRFLLHECTFMDNEGGHCDEARDRGHQHSCLNDVLDLVQETEVQHLALYHISKRYTDEEILRTVRAACAKREIKMKVSVALPGRLHVDLFGQTIWPPRS